jgi:hypothetical protein|eukprot:COSAG01_NODE_2861_length_6959_cov_3.530321_2_plen_83_part_00
MAKACSLALCDTTVTVVSQSEREIVQFQLPSLSARDHRQNGRSLQRLSMKVAKSGTHIISPYLLRGRGPRPHCCWLGVEKRL